MLHLLLAAALAFADPKVGRAEALANTLWAHLTGRYPRLAITDIRPIEGGVLINGISVTLFKPAPALAGLTEIEIVGMTDDPTRPWLLMKTREADPTMIWALYDVRLKRLKIAGYDQPRASDPAELGAVVQSLPPTDLPLFKYLTTRSPMILMLMRELLSAEVSCTPGRALELERQIQRLKTVITPDDRFDRRLRELNGVVRIIDLNPKEFCRPSRLIAWKDALIGIHGRVQAELADLAATDFRAGPFACCGISSDRVARVSP